jgi:hypothetical protein
LQPCMRGTAVSAVTLAWPCVGLLQTRHAHASLHTTNAPTDRHEGEERC